MNIVTEGLCANCNARPRNVGYAYCSKACGNAAMQRRNVAPSPAPSNTPGAAGFLPNIASKAMGMIANRSSSGQSPNNNSYAGNGSTNGYTSSGVWASGPSAQPQPATNNWNQHASGNATAKQNSWIPWISSSTNSGTCIINGCQKPAWVSPSGKVTKYCGLAHKKLGETCGLPGCGKPVYRDPQTGSKGQFCSRAHMQQGSGNNTGPSNSQPVRSNSVPMMSGGGSHTPAAYGPVTVVINAQAGPPRLICHLKGCDKTVWIDPSNGQPSKYCTKAHKSLAQTHQGGHSGGQWQPQHNAGATNTHWQPQQPDAGAQKPHWRP